MHCTSRLLVFLGWLKIYRIRTVFCVVVYWKHESEELRGRRICNVLKLVSSYLRVLLFLVSFRRLTWLHIYSTLSLRVAFLLPLKFQSSGTMVLSLSLPFSWISVKQFTTALYTSSPHAADSSCSLSSLTSTIS
jgi:hypothetical protein